MRFVRLTVASLFLFIFAMGGCTSAETRDWEGARKDGTLSAYEQFLSKHPEGTFTANARSQIELLSRPRDWQTAQSQNTIQGYEEFRRRHSSGEDAEKARALLKPLKLPEDWKNAQSVNTIAAYENFLADHPQGREADVARLSLKGLHAQLKYEQLLADEAAFPIPQKGGHTIEQVMEMLKNRATFAQKIDSALANKEITKDQYQEIIKRNRADSLGLRR